jgi:hypothetical protein
MKISLPPPNGDISFPYDHMLSALWVSMISFIIMQTGYVFYSVNRKVSQTFSVISDEKAFCFIDCKSDLCLRYDTELMK